MTSSLSVVCGLAVLKNMLSSHKRTRITLVLPSAGDLVILLPTEQSERTISFITKCACTQKCIYLGIEASRI